MTTLDDLHTEQLKVYQSIGTPKEYKTGKSIVTSCYRQEITGTYILLTELKRLDFHCPIEVFYREGELIDDEVQELTRLYPDYVVFKKMKKTFEPFTDRWGNQKGWATKVYAILESEYEENFWIDSDNFPIMNCLDLFEDTEYQSKGSLFWRDVYSIDRANQYWYGSDFWKVFNVSPNDAEPFESGQFLINKKKCWKQLYMMVYYTEQQHIYYQFGGDAECWRMAWQYVAIQESNYHREYNYHESADVPYGMMPYGPFHKGKPNRWHKYGGGTVMVQRDRKGAELFNHRNINKFNVMIKNEVNEDVQNEINYHMIIKHMAAKYQVKNV
jgi:Mannosyltransferase putative